MSTAAGQIQGALPPVEGLESVHLERRGRFWLLWSFLACPCHLPWTLAVLTAVFAGTSVGTMVSEHIWVAGSIITLTWVAGTGYGFHLIRRAQRANGTCPVPVR